MGLREEAIAAGAKAIIEERGNREGRDFRLNPIVSYEWPAARKSATAAFDAALAVLSNPDEAMVWAGDEVGDRGVYAVGGCEECGEPTAAFPFQGSADVLRAMLSTLAPDKALP